MSVPATIPNPDARSTHLSLISPNQGFPAYLINEFTQLQSLSLDGISIIPRDFFPILISGHLLPGLANVTSLTLKNMANLPRIILASCVSLQKLHIEAVSIANDQSCMIPFSNPPKLVTLVCKNMDERMFAPLVATVDVTRLRSLECDLVYGINPKVPAGRPRGPQHVLNLCKSSLLSLTLISISTLQQQTERQSMVICDLSQHTVLTDLKFIGWFDPEREYLHPDIPRKLVLDEVLATIPSQVCALKRLVFTTCVKLDQALKPVAPGGPLRLDNTVPLPLFQDPVWNRFDHTVARLANMWNMCAVVNIAGYDDIDMRNLMEKWGRNTFVESRKAPRAEITVLACIKHL